MLKDVKKIGGYLVLAVMSIWVGACGGGGEDPSLFQKSEMEINMDGVIYSDLYNSSRLVGAGNPSGIISVTQFGPIISTLDDGSWPDNQPDINIGIYLSGFDFDTGIGTDTIIDLSNNTSAIDIFIWVEITGLSTGVVGDVPETELYSVVNTGRVLIHKFELPPNPSVHDWQAYHYDIELKDVVIMRDIIRGASFPGFVTVNYSSLCKSLTECVDTR